MKPELHCSSIFSPGHSLLRHAVLEYKYLGIWIDYKFSFKHHIDNLACKLGQKVGFLYRNKSCFPMFCRKRIVEATLLSILDYGDVIYRHAAASTLKNLDSVYHAALRFITGASYDTHHCLLYASTGLTSLAMRREAHWLLFIFKSLLCKSPDYISSLLSQRVLRYPTRQNDWLLLEVPYCRTELGKTAFSTAAAHSWNTLQNTLKLVSPPALKVKCVEIRMIF